MTNAYRTAARRLAALVFLPRPLLLPGALTSLVLVPSSAADPDCGAAGYTGYALKSGTDCRQYVYCQDGSATSQLTCPDGLLYDDAEGICTWPEGVDASKCNPGPDGDGDGRAEVADGFCGTSADDALLQCGQPCVEDGDCCDTSHSCFPTGDACSHVDYGSAGHHYCGMTWCDAADGPEVPCPGGTDAECPDGTMCFADVPRGGRDAGVLAALMYGGSSGGPDEAMHFLSLNIDDNGGDDNPEQFFCGTSEADAARQCVPCPSGRMDECGGDYRTGCFRGIAACAGGSVGGDDGGGGANGPGLGDLVATTLNDGLDSMVDKYLAATNYQQGPSGTSSQPRPSDQVSQATAAPRPAAANQPVPVPAPGTPAPWTNAPFRPTPSRGGDKTVIGYYASWQWYDRNKYADPRNIDFSKYDRINFAFFQPDKDGNLYGTDEWADPQLLWGPYTWSEATGDRYCSWDLPLETGRKCNYHNTEDGLIARAHAAGSEVVPSIGGWTLSDNFPGIAASETRRRNFARQCVELIEAYGFDGIDLDWEYPGYEDHSGTPADTINFTLLLRAMRDELKKLGDNRFGRPYSLTAALPCGPNHIEKIQVDQIKDVLTEVNLMSYDLHGSWDALTGVNAPMFDQGWMDETPRRSVHGCVNNYADRGVPLSMMNMGLPFYGRSFRDASGMKQFHGGADDINYHLDEGTPQYFNIVQELKKMKTYRHEKTQTQYAVFNRGGGVVSYDDPRAICDKVHYANERGMNGFLIWEISGDMIEHNGRMVTPLIDATNNKIRNPNFDCSTLRDPTWALGEQTYRYAPDEPEMVDWSQYSGPSGNPGSTNDFNGAQESVPALIPAPSPSIAQFSTPANNSPGNSGDGGRGNSDNAPENKVCPKGKTGYYPTSNCEKYVYCSNGSVDGVPLPCVPGTLFDVAIGVCTWASEVQCGS